MERYYFTLEGLARARARLADAEAAYRTVCDGNEEAREAGDSSVWHDNFAFEENQRQMHQLAHRVRQLQRVLEGAEVLDPPRPGTSRVVLGMSVRVAVEGEPRQRRCVIAGWDDGDPASGRLSYNSPLGRAVLGASEGDVVEATIAGKVRQVEILEVGIPAREEATCAAP